MEVMPPSESDSVANRYRLSVVVVEQDVGFGGDVGEGLVSVLAVATPPAPRVSVVPSVDDELSVSAIGGVQVLGHARNGSFRGRLAADGRCLRVGVLPGDGFRDGHVVVPPVSWSVRVGVLVPPETRPPEA